MMKRIILIRNAQAYDFGGAERFPVFVAKVLKEHDLLPIVVSRSQALRDFANKNQVKSIKGWWWSYQNWNGIRALLFPIYVLWQIVLFFYYLILFIRIRPSVVHIQSKDDFIAATLSATLLGRRVIWTDHADLKHIWKNLTVWYKNPVGKLVAFCARFTRVITVVSKNERSLIRDNLPEHSAISSKLTVVYNGAFDEYKETSKNKKLTFISTGRLVTDKGITELIVAFRRLREEYNDIQLDIVGTGPERRKFERLAKGVKNITFHGHQSNPQTFLARSDVFVFPTYHEGFSLALVEASMNGLAIIATSVGGNPEIIMNNENGILIAAQDSEAVYIAMKEFYNDAALRKRLGESARKTYLDHFNFENIIESQLLPLYTNK